MIVSYARTMRPVVGILPIAAAAVLGCHGATIKEFDPGDASGLGGRGGTTGTAGGAGGSTSGTAGTSGLPRTLTVVPGTGSSGIAYTKMTAFDNGFAYPVVLDLLGGSNALAPAVVVKAIQLANGATTTLSTSDERLSQLADGRSPVALDATSVYWFSRTTNDGGALLNLRRAPKMGGAQENVTAIDDSVATAPAQPIGMATGGGYVYWAANGNGIYRCPAAVGCGSGPEKVVPTTDQVLAIVVRGDWLYWASITNGKVWRHGLTTPGDQMLDGGPTVGEAATCDIAVSPDDTELWSVQCGYPYEVRRVNIGLMSGSTIANAPYETIDDTAAGAIALGTNTVYFIGSDHVFSLPRASLTPVTPQTLATLATPSGVWADGIIGLDDQYLYLQGSNTNAGTAGMAGYVLRMAR